MSTQSISQNNLDIIKDKLDEVMACISNKLMMSIKLGFRFEYLTEDIFFVNYLFDLINNPTRECFLECEECSIEKLSRLLLKYQ